MINLCTTEWHCGYYWVALMLLVTCVQSSVWVRAQRSVLLFRALFKINDQIMFDVQNQIVWMFNQSINVCIRITYIFLASVTQISMKVAHLNHRLTWYRINLRNSLCKTDHSNTLSLSTRCIVSNSAPLTELTNWTCLCETVAQETAVESSAWGFCFTEISLQQKQNTPPQMQVSQEPTRSNYVGD